MTGAEYVAFIGACVILAVTPGPDTFLTLRFAAHSVRAGFVYSVAVALGVLVWAVLALTGVAALLQRFPEVRAGLTWIGGSYLVFLGLSALVQVHRVRQRRAPVPAPVSVGAGVGGSELSVGTGTASASTAAESSGGSSVLSDQPESPAEVAAEWEIPAEFDSVEPRIRARSHASVFRTGMISSLTNPKTGLFFLALLPPFLPAAPSAADHVILVATVVVVMIAYGMGLSVVARRIGRLLTRGSGPLVVDGVAGAVLVIIGLSLIVL